MKRLVYHTRLPSSHELPLFRALARQVDEAVYVVDRPDAIEGRVGWQCNLDEANFVVLSNLSPAAREDFWNRALTRETLVYYGWRDSPWRDKIVDRAFRAIYAGERWLSPVGRLPGWIRFLSPRFRRTVDWYRRTSATRANFRCFAQGVHAASDFRRLGFQHVAPWGYFIADQEPRPPRESDAAALRLLWLGRMVPFKRVDTLIRALAALQRPNATLTLAGDGPLRGALQALVGHLNLADRVRFVGAVKTSETESLMRGHDVFVLTSDAREGWGVTLCEAMSAGLSVFGTHEAGASATLLPAERRFSCGDWRGLAELLSSDLTRLTFPLSAQWTASSAAARVMACWD